MLSFAVWPMSLVSWISKGKAYFLEQRWCTNGYSITEMTPLPLTTPVSRSSEGWSLLGPFPVHELMLGPILWECSPDSLCSHFREQLAPRWMSFHRSLWEVVSCVSIFFSWEIDLERGSIVCQCPLVIVSSASLHILFQTKKLVFCIRRG